MVGKTFQILLSEFEKMKNEDDYIAEAIDYDEWRNQEFKEDFVPDKWKLGEAQYESQLGFVGKKSIELADELFESLGSRKEGVSNKI